MSGKRNSLPGVVKLCNRRITELEADNKRLREALEAIEEWLMEPFDDEDADNEEDYNVPFRKALRLTRAALKETGDDA